MDLLRLIDTFVAVCGRWITAATVTRGPEVFIPRATFQGTARGQAGEHRQRDTA
jgi:hypothetical protein